jgi:hypothetical protein
MFEKYSPKKIKKPSTIIIISVAILAFSMLFLAMSISHTQSLLNQYKDYTKIGPYGDLIGGVINPVIAFIGIIAASLAFYAQYKANQLIQEQFSIQKFESQFYEMIHLHRENLNEMAIEGYKYDYGKRKARLESKKDKITTGKKVFVTMLKEFEATYLISKKVFYESYKKEELEDFEIKQLIFDHAYYVFFNGIGLYRKNSQRYIKYDKTKLVTREVLDKYINELTKIKEKHENKGVKKHINYFQSQTLWLSFNYKPFSGHQSLLAHYYRHLIQTVKYVVKQDSLHITYEDKRDYLRILRAMLSNHEQILLYYNWLSGFGSSWEKKLEDCHLNKGYNKNSNRFFTDYRMIHNIPDDIVIIDDFKAEKIFDNKYRDFLYETNRRETDTLFEIMGVKSSKK